MRRLYSCLSSLRFVPETDCNKYYFINRLYSANAQAVESFNSDNKKKNIKKKKVLYFLMCIFYKGAFFLL